MAFSALGLISPGAVQLCPITSLPGATLPIHSPRACICSGRSLHLDAYPTRDIQTQTPDLKPSGQISEFSRFQQGSLVHTYAILYMPTSVGGTLWQAPCISAAKHARSH